MDTVVACVAGAALGCLAGWLASARRARPGGGGVEAELRQQLQQREAELRDARERGSRLVGAEAAARAACQGAEERCDEARARLGAAEQAREGALAQLQESRAAQARAAAERAALQASLSERDALHARQSAEAKAAQAQALADLQTVFKALSADALKANAPEFLRLANETLAKSQEAARGDLAQRQESIRGLVKPLEEQLAVYQQRLQQAERAQAEAQAELRKQIELLARQNESLAGETERFRAVLKSSQARGRWGEETLRRVVEAAGMSAHCDFVEQAQEEDKKPDLLVRLPGGRVVIVDAKAPAFDYLAGLDAADQASRRKVLETHAANLRGTIQALAKRRYADQFPGSLDYVVAFLPAESLFSTALEGDPELLVWAAEQQRVMLATPATLIALLRAVSVSWMQHDQTENAKAIVAEAQELYARVGVLTRHFGRIGDGIAGAAKAFNEAVGSYQRSVRPSGERLANLGLPSGGKELADVEPLHEPLRQVAEA